MAPEGGAVLVVVAVPVVLVRRFSDLLCAPPPTNRWNRGDIVGGFFFSSIVNVLFCLFVNGVSDFPDVVQRIGGRQGLVKKPFQLFQRNKLKLE